MRKLLIICGLFLSGAVTAQQVSLDSCYVWTRNNYPNLKKSGIWEQISSLKKDNLKTAYYPQISLKGQATYQSDVTKVEAQNLPIGIPPISKDQYKAYAELQQSIWDGGISKTSSELEEVILQNNLSQLEVEVYKLNEQVSQAFFTALAIQQQQLVIAAQIEVLREKLKSVKSGIENQVTEKSAEWEMEAEILQLEQSQVQLQASESTALNILSILSGKIITNSSELTLDEKQAGESSVPYRPETAMFLFQRTQFEKQADLIGKSRNPKLFGFGQAGYGRPGLNMLNDNFDTYYLVGVGVSWNAFDWKKTSRQKQMLHLQSEMVDRQEETFKQNIELLLAQQNSQISKLEKLLETDNKMLALRSDIVSSSSSKLENDMITTADYIRDVQAETIAKLNREIHRIQLSEAREKYRLIQGKVIDGVAKLLPTE